MLKFIIIAAVTLGMLAPLSPLLAKERIYLLAGQSNMMGHGKTHELPPRYKRTPPNVHFFYQGRLKPLAQTTYFGPEVTFAHEVARAFPNDQHILIKMAATGSSIKQWQYGQPLYYGLLRHLQLALPEYFYRATPPVEAIIWMQGEQDARKWVDARNYQTLVWHFISQLRSDIAAPKSLLIMGRVNPRTPYFKMVGMVQNSQAQLTRTLPYTLLVNTDGLGTLRDRIHYSAKGQMELGRRMARAYIRSRR
ncbi:sialate O-acetylesterase [Thiofilum flexile]|uniref:sialate O-acetylesterase n=1 Tax=Thiofilum flexile TaxID=125627 RepID=UPI00037B8533|nr:sialate O-acetylesterase [Thiofilum flexile]